MSSFAVTGFKTNAPLTEDTFDIGQQITQNPYIQTKYQAEAIVELAQKDGAGNIWHIMNPYVRSIREVADAEMVTDNEFTDLPVKNKCFLIRLQQ